MRTRQRRFVSRLCGGLLLVALALAPVGLRAQDGELPALEYDRLRSRLDELEAEVSRLKTPPALPSAFADDPNSVRRVHSEYVPPAPGYFTPEAGMMSMQPAGGAVPAPAKPKYPTVTVNGFFQADTLLFGQDSENRASLANPVAVPPFDGDLQDGANFRRMRLSAKGAVADNVNYFLQLDFGAFGRPTFTDVWGEVTHVPILGNVRVGQWKQPFGLESVTSVRYQTFLERSVLFQSLEPFRHIGAGFYDWSEDENTTWQFSVFRSRNDQFGDDIGDNGGWSSAGRITHLPWYEKNGDRLDYLHLGVAYWFGDPSNDRFRYATIPEAFVGEFGTAAAGSSKVGVPATAQGTPPFVDTGTFFVNNFTHIGLEGLWVRGPFSVQSEGQLATVNQIFGPQLHYWGMYTQASYFLTGESRPYDRKMGALDRLVPLRPFIHENDCLQGPGAWELAARWSMIDLNSENRNGGRLNDLTTGLNWYLNGYTKFQFNYIHAMLDHPMLGNSHADIVGVRCQVDF
ncbi:MAG: porin [Planctomycetota bacterium]